MCVSKRLATFAIALRQAHIQSMVEPSMFLKAPFMCRSAALLYGLANMQMV
jgi:hypothetical protein